MEADKARQTRRRIKLSTSSRKSHKISAIPKNSAAIRRAISNPSGVIATLSMVKGKTGMKANVTNSNSAISAPNRATNGNSISLFKISPAQFRRG